MSWRGAWAVVKDSLITQIQSGHEATVKESLTVQIEGIANGKAGSATP